MLCKTFKWRNMDMEVGKFHFLWSFRRWRSLVLQLPRLEQTTADLGLCGIKHPLDVQSGEHEDSQSLDGRDAPHSHLVLFTASFRGLCSFRCKAWSSFNLPVRDLLQCSSKWQNFIQFNGYKKWEMDISLSLQGQAKLSSFFQMRAWDKKGRHRMRGADPSKRTGVS